MAAVLDVSSLENAVVAGTETGRVLRCAIKPVDKVPELPRNEKGEVDYTKDVKLVPKNPIIATHSAHTGPVQSVDGSRFHRHLFLSASSDGNVHISNALESERMLVLSPASSLDAYIYSAAWSPYRPLVFAAGSRNSYVYIYDLEQSRVRPAISQRAGVDAIVCVHVCHHPVSNTCHPPGLTAATADVAQHARHLARSSSPHSRLRHRLQHAHASTSSRCGGLSVYRTSRTAHCERWSGTASKSTTR
jgi:WD40 repeat protein